VKLNPFSFKKKKIISISFFFLPHQFWKEEKIISISFFFLPELVWNIEYFKNVFPFAETFPVGTE